MSELTAIKQHYLDAVSAQDAPTWLSSVRTAGAERVAQLDFPNRREEAWRFTNITPIVNTAFSLASADGITPDAAAHLFADEGWPALVFIDGVFSSELSNLEALPEGLTVKPLADLTDAEQAVAAKHLDAYTREGKNIYTALNSAYLRDGAYVHVARKAAIDTPVHIAYLQSGQADTAVFPRILVVAESLAEVSVVETFAGLSDDAAYLTDSVAEYVLADGAQVSRYKVLQEGANGYHLAAIKAHQDRDSKFTSYSFVLGGKIARNELGVCLDGEGASCGLNGLYLTDGDMLVDNATVVDHAKPHCESWIGYKGVLDDTSSAVFSGGVMVRRDAQKTNSNQLNQNLLLSDEVTVDTKPLLEIFADDVKCTHGATVGQHPDPIIFYFKSRGMSEDMARGMLTYGFADEVVNQVEIDALRKRLDKFAFDRYSPEAIRKHA